VEAIFFREALRLATSSFARGIAAIVVQCLPLMAHNSVSILEQRKVSILAGPGVDDVAIEFL